MANDITGNPLVLDTVSAASLTTKTFVVHAVRWVGATTAGHTVSVQNSAGNVIWASEASGANYVEGEHFDKKPLVFAGLKIPTLASGIVYLYVESAVPIPT